MNIYFSGIGGVGIGPLTQIALDAGYQVQGSDMADSPLTRQLRERGVSVSIGQDGAFLNEVHKKTPVDWFVYTSALKPDHPELVLAKKLGIKTAKRDELLALIIREHNLRLIAIAGTHGKTTTTGMMVWTMQQLGVPVSYSVGSTILFGPSGKFDPKSKYFVYECDEFDRNFLHFEPYLALIASIDYDHPDTYPTRDSYMEAFRTFVGQSARSIMWEEDARKLGEKGGDNWLLRPEEASDVRLAGAHTRRNATLVLKAVEYLGLSDRAKALAALTKFPGTGRRFERLGENVYSDYGHHPSEIAATLQMAREVSNHVVLVYQPHQNVRQHEAEIRKDYAHCFDKADEVYWLPTYLSREDPSLAILTPEELIKSMAKTDSVHVAALDDDLWTRVQKARKDGKLVLFMGAGSIDAWVRGQLNLGDSAPVKAKKG